MHHILAAKLWGRLLLAPLFKCHSIAVGDSPRGIGCLFELLGGAVPKDAVTNGNAHEPADRT